MHKHAFTADGGKQADLCRADDRARPHGHISWLDVVAGAADVGTRAHRPQDTHP
jgi:hypothetical protein